MNTKIPLLLFIVFCLGVFPAVQAGCVVEKQGDPVYIGEYCDVSKVMSWSGSFAYFSSGYESSTPTRVVTIEGFMYHTYIDPSKFVVGDWYKWENVYERGGNNLAFRVMPGTRNSTATNETATPDFNVTPTETEMIPENTNPMDTELLLARGDSMAVSYYNEEWGQDAYLWFFGGINTKIMGLKMDLNEGVNSYTFKPEETSAYTVGKYTGYIQFVGANNRPDVFYNASRKVLDSPYKDVKPVNVDGFLPSRIQEEFEILSVPSENCDDNLIPITMEVVEPEIKIGDYWEEADEIVIEGTTSLSKDTVIKVFVDPEHYALPAEIAANTYSTKAVGETKSWRRYSIAIPLKWGEMGVNQQHKIRASVTKYKIKVSVDQDFKVTGEWVNPTPTLIFRKVIVDEFGTHVVDEQGRVINTSANMSTPYPTETPRPTMTPPVVKSILTTAQTQDPKVPTPKPVPTDDITIPLNPVIAIGAVFIVGVMIMRRK